ncbi:MAG: hypothetical protein RL266_773 [Bacteroidota bacterium]|jgi:uncharacterized protein YdeI (YjbR/CyaY-like superfamily)
MNTQDPQVDTYLIDGCGRCSYYQTPHCKVHSWTDELKQLRQIVLDCGLTEEFKWSQPCYTYQNKNILIVTAFKEYASLAFFKGTLLQDEKGILVAPGKNSQAGRQIRFTSVEDIIGMEPTLKAYIYEALEVEKGGLKANFKKNPEPIPDELQQRLDEFPDFKTAFEALTPGRQRGYIIHFSQPKQSKTRTERIEKCIPKIMNGEGLHDTYKAAKK